MPNEDTSQDEKQCRICLDGVTSETTLGRLIRPCLCKGSISYVHIKCLHRWRNTSASNSAFFACPQCRYHYRFTRTRIVGIATNPIVVGGLSGLIFTIIVMLSSFVTTFFMSWFEQPSTTYFFSSSFIYVSPFSAMQDLITAALRIIQDEDIGGLFNDTPRRSRSTTGAVPVLTQHGGFLLSFLRRFILGLPMVGAGSLVYMLLSAPLIGPLQFLARRRGNRSRRDQSRDVAALLILALLLAGAARALYQVYRMTEKGVKRFLLRAEEAILEVN